jgi:hypothetical protein
VWLGCCGLAATLLWALVRNSRPVIDVVRTTDDPEGLIVLLVILAVPLGVAALVTYMLLGWLEGRR